MREPSVWPLKRECGRAVKPLIFAVIDIKKFSRIENWYDHAVGDQVLKRVYEALRSCLKENEVLCRASADQYYLPFGGDGSGIVVKTAAGAGRFRIFSGGSAD